MFTSPLFFLSLPPCSLYKGDNCYKLQNFQNISTSHAIILIFTEKNLPKTRNIQLWN